VRPPLAPEAHHEHQLLVELRDEAHIDPQQRWVVGNADVNTSWVFYGRPVQAVAAGRVITAVDRFPNQIPNHPRPVTLREADGNHVTIALGHGRYAFYAHLLPGSVRVRRGQRVRAGQLIGKLGNSGSSTGPHLHFHVMDGPSPLASDGLPFVFKRFRLVGRIPPFDAALEATINAGEPTSVATSLRFRADRAPRLLVHGRWMCSSTMYWSASKIETSTILSPSTR
jgi:hypothetical protein